MVYPSKSTDPVIVIGAPDVLPATTKNSVVAPFSLLTTGNVPLAPMFPVNVNASPVTAIT